MGIKLPEFRESNGDIDWRQILDMFVPGDIYNSRTNEYRPVGMVAGAASMFGGPLAGAAVEAVGDRDWRMPQFNNPFSGMSNPFGGRQRTVSGSGDRTNMGPYNGFGPTNATPGSFDQDTWGTRPRNPVADISQGPAQDFRMQGYQDPRPRPMRGGEGGYNGRSLSLANGLGEGQRRTADQIMAEQMEFLENMRNRNGALMER